MCVFARLFSNFSSTVGGATTVLIAAKSSMLPFVARRSRRIAKHLSIDGAIAVIGSSNMDIRSFVLNSEVSLVVYDAEVTARLREQEERYFATSERLSQVAWMKRSAAEKICENLARLLSPLL
jgi:hypothetical protein